MREDRHAYYALDNESEDDYLDDAIVGSEIRMWAYFIAAIIVAAFIAIMSSSHTIQPAPVSHDAMWLHKFLDIPDTKSISNMFEKTCKEQSIAGSPGAKVLRDYVKQELFRSVPVVETFEYNVLLSKQRKASLKLTSPTGTLLQEFDLEEPAIPEDPSSQNRDIVQPFIAYSASGFVSAYLVYANYGRKEDFAKLRQNHISVSGCVVLVRNGKLCRGAKVLLAQEHGAVAVIFYSDDADDSFEESKVYPHGPYRPPKAIEAGSSMFINLYPGDPLTPGVAATQGLPDSRRQYTADNAPTLPRIPVLAIGYSNAKSLLLNLTGINVKKWKEWEGSLNISYHSGPSSNLVSLEVQQPRKVSTIVNIVATFQGEIEPEKRVIVGNHRDAWAYGAADPHSGTAAFLELARSLGVLYNQGWKPRRSIVLCSWDAAEYGLLGSVEYAEEFQNELRRNAIAYLNVDAAVTGTDLLSVSASPTMENVLRVASKFIPQPGQPNGSSKTLFDAWNERSDALIAPLDFGSDYTPFLQFLGIASMDVGFSNASHSYGVYHSSYDSVHWMKSFTDPNFEYCQAITKFWGAVTLLLSDRRVLPFVASKYSERLQEYVKTVLQIAATRSPKIDLDLQHVNDGLRAFDQAATHLDSSAASLLDIDPASTAVDVNHRLSSIDRSFLSDMPHPDRLNLWYRHIVFAPSRYHRSVLSGITEALLNGDAAEAQRQTDGLAKALQNAANSMQQT